MEPAFFSKIYTQNLSNNSISCTYLARVDDFTLDLSDFVLSLHVVPELRPSQDGITCEDAHSVQLGILVVGGWQAPTDNVELSHL